MTLARPKKDLKPGHRIQVTPQYLREAMDCIEPNFILLALSLWRKWDKDDARARSRTISDIVYENLVAERWQIARSLSAFLKDDTTTAEADRLRGQINYWQSFKWAGEYEAVQAEIEAADYSTKAPLFRLALLAITDRLDEFFELLPAVLQQRRVIAEKPKRMAIVPRRATTSEVCNLQRTYEG